MGTLRNNSKYVQRDWINNETPLNAKNLNNIEQGISEIKNILADYEGALDGAPGTQILNTAVDDNNQKQKNEATGEYSTAAGLGTKATHEAEFAVGKYNESIEEGLFIVGSGNKDERKNAFEVTSIEINTHKPTTVNSTLNVTDKATLVNTDVADLNASGEVTFESTLEVSGKSTLSETEAASLMVTGNTVLANTSAADLTASGNVTLGDADSDTITIKGNLTAEQAATFSTDVTVEGNLAANNASFQDVDLVEKEGNLTIPTYTAAEGETLNDKLAVNHATLNIAKTDLQAQIDAHDSRIEANEAAITAIEFFFEGGHGEPLDQRDAADILDTLKNIQDEFNADNNWQSDVDDSLGTINGTLSEHSEKIDTLQTDKANLIKNDDGSTEDLANVKEYASGIKSALETNIQGATDQINNSLALKADKFTRDLEYALVTEDTVTPEGNVIKTYTYTLSKNDLDVVFTVAEGHTYTVFVKASNDEFSAEGSFPSDERVLSVREECAFTSENSIWVEGAEVVIQDVSNSELNPQLLYMAVVKNTTFNLEDVYDEIPSLDPINNNIDSINEILNGLPERYLEKHFKANDIQVASLEGYSNNSDPEGTCNAEVTNVPINLGKYYVINNPEQFEISSYHVYLNAEGRDITEYFDFKGNPTQFPEDYDLNGFTANFSITLNTSLEEYNKNPITINEFIYETLSSGEIYDSLTNLSTTISGIETNGIKNPNKLTIIQDGVSVEYDGSEPLEIDITKQSGNGDSDSVVQSNWNETDSTSEAYIVNKPYINNGSGEKSIVIGEGEAAGAYSIAGGTNDKSLISDLAGGLASLIANIDVSKAEGDMSLSFGAGTKSRTAGTLSIGVNSNAGCKGFYFTAVSGTTLTLSNKQPSSLSSGAKWDATSQALLNNWKANDVLTIVNDKTYAMCSKIVSITNTSTSATITVDKLPFTNKASNSLTPNFNDFIIINHNKPDDGVAQYGMGAVSIGMENESQGLFSKAEGRENSAFGNYSHAEGQDNKAGHGAHSEGRGNNALGNHSHSEGYITQTGGEVTITIDGTSTKYSGDGHYAHSEGNTTKAIGESSHSEGVETISVGKGSHSEGRVTKATGNYSHSEGYNNIASGEYAHSEGYETTASGRTSHAEGAWAISKGVASHAEGRSTEAQANYSHTEGYGTIATTNYQHVQGKFNALDANGKSGNYAHIIGNGSAAEYDSDGNLTKAEVRSNAYTLDWNGNAWFAGKVTVGTNKDTLATQAWVKANAGSAITIDSTLSTTSTNPIQNAIITKEVNDISSSLSDTIAQVDKINTLLTITTTDIDEICGSSIVAATSSEVTF